jgi:non-ribosomal peptide synthetase component F
MAQVDPLTLWQAAKSKGSDGRWIASTAGSVLLAELDGGSAAQASLETLRGRSVLIRSNNQLPAALALLELDGLARRHVLCPPDVDDRYLSNIAADADVDVVVGDALPAGLRVEFVACTSGVSPARVNRRGSETTEWVHLTSGTTGSPKLVVHTLKTLTAAIRDSNPARSTVWSTFYDIRRYGGLQIFLRAMLGGSSLALSDFRETVADFLFRVGACGVTHISGTPLHWRATLMSSANERISPRYVRLSGGLRIKGSSTRFAPPIRMRRSIMLLPRRRPEWHSLSTTDNWAFQLF